jgi:rubrerythrin
MGTLNVDEDVDELEDIIDDLEDLIQLDRDAAKAYDIALDKATDRAVREDLLMFKLDHERHVDDLGRIVVRLGGETEDRGHGRGLLRETLAVLRGSRGTLGALKALRMSEKLTNTLYAKALEEPLTIDAREVVEANRDDERRHLIAIKGHLARLDHDYFDDDEEDELVMQSPQDDRPPLIVQR